ncbi:MAG TPA: peptide deformylase [Acidobacteriota bacterium]|nr:peptide deformylase [Acidobacteriota bacterium]
MAILEILKIGHPMLARKADSVTAIDEDLVRLAGDMVETLHAAPGIGLAAPQVDISRRLIVVDLSVGENPDDLIILVNPEIVAQEGQVVCKEGCLSVPDVTEKVARPYRVRVKGLDLEGRETSVEGEDILARALCHEIDHLDGKLFIERLSPLKRALVKKKIRKQREANSGR